MRIIVDNAPPNMPHSMMSAIKKILSSGLNLKIASTVLISIVLVEAVTLIPSVMAEKHRKLMLAENHARLLISTLEAALQYEDDVADSDFYARQLNYLDLVKGYAICNNTGCPITFGEAVNASELNKSSSGTLVSDEQTRLETHKQLIAGTNPHWVILRTDISGIKSALLQYILKTLFAVAFICLFVTVTTTTGLIWVVIRPIHKLTNNIQRLLTDPQNPLKYMQKIQSNDEIGDLTKTFNRLLFDINNYQKVVRKTQKEVEKGLSASEARWKFALEGAGDGVWDWNPVSDDVFFSKPFLNFIGYDEGEFISKMISWPEHIHPKDVDASSAAMANHLKGDTEFFSFEHRIKHKAGRWVWTLSRGMVINRGEDGLPTRVVGTHTDITKHKEAESLIWKQANIDLLTGLPNRRLFQAQLYKAVKSCQKNKTGTAVLILLDLDNFKNVNDSYGHQAGDALLKQAAKRLNKCTTKKGIAARLGGDEFAVVLGNITDKKIVEDIAKDILKELSTPFEIGIETFHVSASIGITNYPDDAKNIESLIMNADQAMYKSKELGRNCYSYFSREMRTAAQERMRSINELREAFKENQFEVFYQPIINFDTSQIVKAEALIRWNHPSKGLVGADTIVPLSEETGLIIDIGNWVFQKSTTQLAEWRSSCAPELQLSINTSPVQYQSDECIVADWYEQMDKLELPYNSLVVEITENIMLDLNSKVKDKLDEFRKAGVELALDDFGTGYSSLAYLKNLNSNYLKIDRSFVKNMSENDTNMTLCLEIIKIAHIFGMKVIAEGVETKDQAQLLSDSGCDYGQGYYYAKPLPAKEFESLLLAQKQSQLEVRITA